MIEQVATAVGAWPEGQPRDVYEDMNEVTLGAFLVALFGADLPGHLAGEFTSFMPDIMEGTILQTILPPWVTRLPVDHLATDAPRHTWRTRNALDGLAQALPDVRRLADHAPTGEVLAAALSLLDGDDPADEHSCHDVRRFLRSLDDPHEPVRYEAVLGLQRWAEATGSLPPDEDGRAHRRLTTLTGDASARLRRATTRLLHSLDTPR